MRILLLVTAFNGLSQRAWCALREAGHDVSVLFATSEADMISGVQRADPELIICPFLKDRVPAKVWQSRRTVIIHPGPVGDRGPSSLDWAIAEGARSWGVTALQAVEEMDAGPIWATRTFALPAAPPRKSSLYNGPVADAAMECVLEVVTKAHDPAFTPVPAGPGKARPLMRQPDRTFDWSDPTEQIVRKIRAADGAPGVKTEVGGLPVFAYDALPGLGRGGHPGQLLSRRQGAVLVGTGDGSVWLGHLRPADPGHGRAGIKLPATSLLGARLRGVVHSPLPVGSEPEHPGTYRQVRYRRTGAVGWLAFDFYNGAMAPGHCRRLIAALRHAVAQDTEVLVLRGGTDSFSNGIHLNVIEASTDPAGAAWVNIRAINEVCREIITCTRQVVIAGYAGSAGAGGVMLGLGADIVAARDGIVLNPYYDMGLYGSELHTFTLPRRVGAESAQRLIDEKLPVSAARARSIGLVDEVGPRHPDAYADWLAALAERESEVRTARNRRQAKARRLAAERVPIEVYEAQELAEMSRDMYADRSGFAAARLAFVRKVKATETPARLLPPTPAKAAPKSRRTATLRPAVPVSA
ncbi:putative two-component system hydrogenase maturation factor HypX/HoxX [Actinoplanes tereljensis]|uniref:Formyl transferase n=1 Tax=Paractinoplanes tereljensis TaxID=571912 RepID=A0A919NIG9_9ACTN|nr:enoyl-CoA hydratase-related protein [Actinoplanes tereljensis]GIF19306.1 formyl transferase [Actinoplanes tereljensis]